MLAVPEGDSAVAYAHEALATALLTSLVGLRLDLEQSAQSTPQPDVHIMPARRAPRRACRHVAREEVVKGSKHVSA